jgi:alkanesulfonate monooxygenase SsuD/methylene tetrahydromethanopterin reductase-like flavin-dependent oxidoreductase (luciferase family)
VAAVGEAIEIIRGVWDADERTPLRVPGAHHRVEGAKRGPRPAHDIAIWLGALKPRMLRLIGRSADGWLPSLAYLGVDAIAESHATIDEAAADAGREPAAIRRLLNVGGSLGGDGLSGPPATWGERLTELTLTHGFATFILATDDADDLAVFGAEVAPAVRDAVATERARAA